MKNYKSMTDVELWNEIKRQYGEKWSPNDIKNENLKREFWIRAASGRQSKKAN